MSNPNLLEQAEAQIWSMIEDALASTNLPGDGYAEIDDDVLTVWLDGKMVRFRIEITEL